jgi:hypothetical protein
MKCHSQKWVKVNVPVDEGISGIISALGEFPLLETVESCQGDNVSGPWVCFRYGVYWDNSWCELSNFVLGYLSPRLYETVGDDVSIKIQTTPTGNIFGELSVRPGAASRVEAALWNLARDFSVSQRRNSGYCGGTSGTLP